MIDYSIPRWLKTINLNYSHNHAHIADEMHELKSRLSKFIVSDPLVSIVIPAWNEEENITKTIASLAYNEFDFPCELIVVNNNSTDNTQALLDALGVRSFLEMNQGIAPARRCGLLESRGKYHLCCDSDTIYPPTWIKTMTDVLQNSEKQGVACIYGSYSFIPSTSNGRPAMALYETATSIVRLFKSRKTEIQRVLGFNFGFNRAIALKVNGFMMEKPRKYRNEKGSVDFVYKSEDGVMASSIKAAGYNLLFVEDKKARVWTSNRRLLIDGGLWSAIWKRVIKLFTH